MKLLYTSDLHGSEKKYARLIHAAKTVRPDVVVLGGDLLLDDSPLLPEQLGLGQPRFVREAFRKFATDLRAAGGSKGVLVIFGNHDWGSSAKAMRELASAGVVTVLDLGQPTVIDGVSFLGYSCTPPTPWYVKDFERLDKPGDKPPLLGGARWDERFSRPTTRPAVMLYGNYPSMSEELADMRAPAGSWVFVAHCPPVETKLDRSFDGAALGSRAIREAIEKHQPTLSLHGHIHESPRMSGAFQDRLGRTIAVNVGQSMAGLSYAVITLDAAAGRVVDVHHEHET